MPLIRVYKSGRVERYFVTDTTPASLDPATEVSSKGVAISPDIGVSTRLYIPKQLATTGDHPEKRLPVLVYYHGGGFCLGTAFNRVFHDFVNSLVVAQANVVAVSAEYRLAPEHSLPAAYEDSWAILRWVAAHAAGGGHAAEAWLVEHADFERVYLAGESARGNIVHHMAMRAGRDGLPCGVRIRGMTLIHPYFFGIGQGRVGGDGPGDEREFGEAVGNDMPGDDGTR
ncbi:hypothetical protein Cni_G04917 [Canna indica]|uniref:Alpha/beta hydrolase fold-3 domain-containing protein n=1 Tax=Canna indica TaxID=4628 RepID=A0AAQ3Q2N5_9LILI|nr:hypothetical protein Cni_G04917 [Canna indica]